MPLACATVYDEILKWSKGRPEWQRDALRRLMIAGSLGPKDIDELTLLCKTSFRLADSSQHKLAAIPLSMKATSAMTQSPAKPSALPGYPTFQT